MRSAEIVSVGTLWWYLRNAFLDDIMQSRSQRKWVESRISLVKMSLGLMIPGIWSIWTFLSWWHSRTWFSLRLRYLIPLEVTLADHWTQA